MKYLSTLTLILFVFIRCASNSASESNDIDNVQGSWVNKEDSNSKLTFNGNRVILLYGAEELEECFFSINRESCDKSYSTIKATFMELLCEEKMCFEVTALTESILSYRETSTGTLHVFEKVK